MSRKSANFVLVVRALFSPKQNKPYLKPQKRRFWTIPKNKNLFTFLLGIYSVQILQAKFMQNKLVAGRKISPIYFLQKKPERNEKVLIKNVIASALGLVNLCCL